MTICTAYDKDGAHPTWAINRCNICGVEIGYGDRVCDPCAHSAALCEGPGGWDAVLLNYRNLLVSTAYIVGVTHQFDPTIPGRIYTRRFNELVDLLDPENPYWGEHNPELHAAKVRMTPLTQAYAWAREGMEHLLLLKD